MPTTPEAYDPLLAEVSHAVWLLPTPAFRRKVFDRRGGTAWGFPLRAARLRCQRRIATGVTGKISAHRRR
ncbi:hypothetical protein Acsp03_58660 [Actinomadura sp. NBRC 104412]|nr:hypothetical protein Acsp03_58660 [Actinomadura sp. NBRC 104412]